MFIFVLLLFCFTFKINYDELSEAEKTVRNSQTEVIMPDISESELFWK